MKLTINGKEIELQPAGTSSGNKERFAADHVDLGDGLKAFVKVYRDAPAAAPAREAKPVAPKVRKAGANDALTAALIETLSPEQREKVNAIMAKLGAAK